MDTIRKCWRRISYVEGKPEYMDVGLKEEGLSAHSILNVLSENNKMGMFEASLSLLNSERRYIQILPNQLGVIEYALDLQPDNVLSKPGSPSYWLGALEYLCLLQSL